MDIATSVSLSLLILLINNPFCISNTGLLLSYSGTIGIILFEKDIEKLLVIEEHQNSLSKHTKLQKLNITIRQMLAVTISAQIIILPIMILMFNTISFTFFISNILAGIFIGIIVICGYVLIIVSFVSNYLAKCGFIFYNLILKLFLFIVEICSKLPFSQIYVITPNIIFIIIYYLVILGIHFSIIKVNKIKKLYKKIIAIILILILIFNVIKFTQKNLRVYFIDVGQGDSTLIITPENKKILIDGGGSKESEGFDVGESTLVPYLLNRGVNKLDYVIISHFDADHCNGIIAVINKIKVDKVVISEQAEICNEYVTIINLIKEKNIYVQIVKQGDKIQFDKYVYLNILYPTKNLKFSDINNNSIVAKLVYGKISILFTGDIEKEAEAEILALYKETNILNSTILKVGHHGSKTSSTKEFIEVVKPKYALIGVGANNTFGHPNEQVIERLQENGVRIYRTDKNGEISIIINLKGIQKINTMLNE